MAPMLKVRDDVIQELLKDVNSGFGVNVDVHAMKWVGRKTEIVVDIKWNKPISSRSSCVRKWLGVKL